MLPEGSDTSYAPSMSHKKGPDEVNRWARFSRNVAYTTFGIAFIFMILSITLIASPSWGASLSQPVSPFFFVLLLVFQAPPVSLVSVFAVMFALYLVFFISMMYENRRVERRNILDTPIGYFAAVATSVELVVIIITLIEEFFGTQIGGSGIDSQLQSNPLLGYMSLIYAPFVEELGFRIIPIGLFSYFLVRHYARKSSSFVSMKDSLLAIVLPGHIRKKYGIKMGYADWGMVFITSAIFGYAHIFFGAWDWGKFIPVFITGIALAIGFMKFGAYVDIPFHWFFNGLLTVSYLNASLNYTIYVLIIWILFAGAVGLVGIIVYARNRLSGRTSVRAS